MPFEVISDEWILIEKQADFHQTDFCKRLFSFNVSIRTTNQVKKKFQGRISAIEAKQLLLSFYTSMLLVYL